MTEAGELWLAKEQRRGDLFSKYSDAIASGFSVGGVVVQLDNEAMLRMATVLAELRAGVSNAHGGFWISADNSRIELDDDEAAETLVAAVAARLALDQWYLAARDAIAKATTEDEVLGIDIEIGGQ